MNFFKRYYDKVILFALFILFVGLMFYVLGIAERAESVSKRDLELVAPRPNDDLGKEKDSDYQYKKLWEDSKFVWQSSRKAENGSDLVVAEQLAECPFCSKRIAENGGTGRVLIPRAAFGKECPNIHSDGKSTLPAPMTAEELALASSVDGFDSDADGISDADEETHKLNKHDKNDARYDNDGDGFSNRYEISKGTDPNDYNSCPPLWSRLRVVKVETTTLPIQLLGVITSLRKGKEAPKDQWIIQCKEPTYKRRTKQWLLRDKELSIGGRVLIEHDQNSRYKVKDITKFVDEAAKLTKFKVELEEILPRGSKLVPRIVVMTSGEPVKSQDVRPVIIDTGRPGSEPIIRRIGARFEIYRHPDTKVDKYFEEYEVVSCNDKNHTVKLRKASDRSDSEEFEITQQGEIPMNDTVIEKQ